VKIVIFGGGGFIGSAIVDRLLLDGQELRVFERPRVSFYREFGSHESVEWLSGDILSEHDLSAALDGMEIVLHLVSTTLPKTSNDDVIYDVQSNLVGTLKMLELMRKHGVRRIIFISSGGTIYGSPEYLPIDERHPTNPYVSYGVTKLAIEKYLLMFRRLYGIEAGILRVSNPFGERQRVETAQGAVAAFLRCAILGQPIEIWGDGSVTRDYLYVGDVAEAFARAVAYSGDKSVFNIGSGIGTSVNELVSLIEEVLGRSIDRSYLPGRPFDVPVSILSNSLAREELEWRPKVSLREGIARTALWMQRQSAK
jgi:UDP-glucose 4-epimerase